MRVLIVDDNPDIQKGIKLLLDWRRYGFTEYLSCSSAKAALEILSDEPRVDLILTDIQMDGMNGIELLRAIQDQGLCSRCIVMSAYADFQYAQAVMACGVRYYLLKPISTVELERSVREMFFESLPGKHEKKAGIPFELTEEGRGLYQEYTDYVKQNYRKNISVESFAGFIHVNPSYAGQVFRRVVGKNFPRYLNEYRVEKAKEIMDQSKLSTYEICEAVGYKDISYFYRIFKVITDMTPNHYRNQNK